MYFFFKLKQNPRTVTVKFMAARRLAPLLIWRKSPCLLLICIFSRLAKNITIILHIIRTTKK